jgi:hypothetical protein
VVMDKKTTSIGNQTSGYWWEIYKPQWLFVRNKQTLVVIYWTMVRKSQTPMKNG